MTEYEIVKLEPKDYSKCGNVWNMAHPSTQKWYDELVSGNRVIFVYTVNGEFLGEGALVFENGDPDYTIANKRIYLSRLAVKQEYRKQGIGSTITDYLIQYAKNHGYEEMSVGVDTININARHLYEKKGFTDIIFEGEDEQGEYVKLLKTL